MISEIDVVDVDDDNPDFYMEVIMPATIKRRAYAVARGPLGRFAPVSEIGETAVPAKLPPVFTNDDGTFREAEGLVERTISLLKRR